MTPVSEQSPSKEGWQKYSLTVLFSFSIIIIFGHSSGYGLFDAVFGNVYKEPCSPPPLSYLSLMSVEVMSQPRLSACIIMHKAYWWLSFCVVRAQNVGPERSMPSHQLGLG